MNESSLADDDGPISKSNNRTQPIIAFLSDLGIVDDAVAMCKGLMLTICPDANIIDITHMVTPFDVEEGAQYLVDLPRYFRPGTVFASIIYPETGQPGSSIAVRNDLGHLFVTANNGLLTRMIGEYGLAEVYEVTDPAVIQAEPTSTFYGRDIVASAAAHLAAGFPLAKVGRQLDRDEFFTFDVAKSFIDEAGGLVGEVSAIDRNFGNVWTNISQKLLVECGAVPTMEAELEVGHLRMLIRYSRTFSDVGESDPLLYINSRGHLSFALNKANFADSHNISRGMLVHLRWSRASAEAGNSASHG